MLATIIILILLAIILIAGILSYRKKLTRGCCGSGGDPAEKRTSTDKNPDDYPFSYILEIKGMTCKNCAARIENRFNQAEGYYAKVNLRKNSALVRTSREVTEGDLKSIVARAGYHAANIQKA